MTEASRPSVKLGLRSSINSQTGVSFGELGRVGTSMIVLEGAVVIAYPNLTIRNNELARQHAKLPRLTAMGPKLGAPLLSPTPPKLIAQWCKSRFNGQHVDSRCISVDDQIICGHWDLATVRADAETSKVKVYGKFDSEDATRHNEKGGCELTTSWPFEYANVRYQDDTCLHDADGNIINNQCYTESAKDEFPSPYEPIRRREYTFSVDQVIIYSSGWMLNDGSNLWKQMCRCGPVTRWEFSPVPNHAGQKLVLQSLSTSGPIERYRIGTTV